MVDSVKGFNFTTLWDTASYMLATIAAYRLDIIAEEEFSNRMDNALNALIQMPLYNDELPNKSYDTKTLSMTDYQNRPTEEGIGWSAIDIGRLCVPLNVLLYEYPEFTPQVRAVVSRWTFDRMFRNGIMYGTSRTNDVEQVNQEGRLGYEEYVSKSFALLGFDISEAYNYRDFTGFVDVEDVEVPVDLRLPSQFGAHTYTLSEPYILDGVEFGWDYYSREFSYRVYLAQKNRYENTGIVTAVTETALDDDPYFVYNTVFGDGIPWASLTSDGLTSESWRTLSTKAALGWAILYDTDYSAPLLEKVRSMQNETDGFYAGIYEQENRTNTALTCNTNGVILEIFHFKVFGPYLKIQGRQ
ncbi:DUF3131 domain-containing protein [Pseudodesulfovibrio sp. JC047]|uniref:DUF3131 domain-containing protein n=1 Tax=Pseudodesulfovibrio sp. JC047 TaxID=2683199 RepID=UPI001EF2EFD0|nr:DUF3131 domain-containing protein [Pseudodesulfovibrio sp. JC047]